MWHAERGPLIQIVMIGLNGLRDGCDFRGVQLASSVPESGISLLESNGREARSNEEKSKLGAIIIWFFENLMRPWRTTDQGKSRLVVSLLLSASVLVYLNIAARHAVAGRI